MAMSRGVAMSSIVIGCVLLILTLISIICGAVATSKMPRQAMVSIGLWGIYFAIPGVLSIIAGYKGLHSVLGVALGTHVFGIILAIVGMALGAFFWAILSSTCFPFHRRIFNEYCVCHLYSKVEFYEASCDDLKIVQYATGAVTIIFALCSIVTFVGSIYGCIGTCCAPEEPTVIVTTAVPAHANTVFVTNNTQQSHAYGMQPLPYGEPGGYAQDQVVVDQKY